MSKVPAGNGPAMTTKSTDRDASSAALMATQSALVFAGLLFGGYDLGADVPEAATADPADCKRTAAAPAAVDLMTAA